MRIGLDLDNTIVCYDQVFESIAKAASLIDQNWVGSKKELRNFLKKQKNGEFNWQKMQGMVYGKYMYQSVIFEGVSEFLLQCKTRKIPVNIVSHKTEFGHYDPEKIPLRDVAMSWLENQGFFEESKFALSKDDVWFESTRDEKLNKIQELKCTHFIDDLIEIFSADNFPNDVKRYLFTAADTISDTNDSIFVTDSWDEISRKIFNEELDGIHV